MAFVTAGGLTNATVAHSLYGYCTTGASTVAKTVTMYKTGSTAGASWAAGDLVHGLTITVRFQYSNTAANPTLNVNSTGAKPIYKYGTTVPGTTVDTSWPAQAIVQLTYDTLLNASGCWVMNDHIDNTNTTYSSLSAANGGTDVSLVTTGEKYTWNNKTNNTGTVTSVGVSNATNGGLSVSGSPITGSGSITVGHSNVLSSAQTTQAVYPIKIDKNGHISAYGSAVSVPTKVSDLTNDSGFISSYTETDPVFSASAAAGITSTDISNWNAKVSDDKTWNGVGLAKQSTTNSGDSTYVPLAASTSPVNMSFTPVKKTPTANAIAKYDASAYLYSTTPSAGDNSTKVATAAYVDNAISNAEEISISSTEPTGSNTKIWIRI